MKSKDWIALIEAGYSLEGDDEVWVKNVLDQAVPFLENKTWPSIGMWRFTATTVELEQYVNYGPSEISRYIHDLTKGSSRMVDLLFREGTPIISMSEHVFSQFPSEQASVFKHTLGQAQDWLGIRAYSGIGRGIGMVVGYFKDFVSPGALERKRWTLITSHLGAGLRLREFAQSVNLDAEPVEAIFDADGKLHDARDEGKNREAQGTLRKMVKRIDQLRTREGRKDPDHAMELWEGLVDGRWSLVDHFDTDRRRFVVAVKNDPTYPDPRGLTMRERQVAEFAGLGQSSKEISYTLGLSQSAITNCTARAQNKLGLSSRTELAMFFAQGGLRAKLAEVSVNGEELLVGAYPLINEDRIKLLTAAECEVLAHLVAGSTNGDIAQRRKTSEYTVANQVQSIFRKLQVTSRSELAACLQNVA